MSTIENTRNTPTAEDFAEASFSMADGRPWVRSAPDYPFCWTDGISAWRTNEKMAHLAAEGRARIIREAPTTATALFEAGWEAAHPVPEGREIPAGVGYAWRNRDGNIHTFPQGAPHLVDPLQYFEEFRTLEPLPDLEPEWSKSEFVWADQFTGSYRRTIYRRADEDTWRNTRTSELLTEDEMAKRNPAPVPIEEEE